MAADDPIDLDALHQEAIDEDNYRTDMANLDSLRRTDEYGLTGHWDRIEALLRFGHGSEGERPHDQ